MGVDMKMCVARTKFPRGWPCPPIVLQTFICPPLHKILKETLPLVSKCANSLCKHLQERIPVQLAKTFLVFEWSLLSQFNNRMRDKSVKEEIWDIIILFYFIFFNFFFPEYEKVKIAIILLYN